MIKQESDSKPIRIGIQELVDPRARDMIGWINENYDIKARGSVTTVNDAEKSLVVYYYDKTTGHLLGMVQVREEEYEDTVAKAREGIIASCEEYLLNNQLESGSTVDPDDIAYMPADEYDEGYYYNKFTGKIIEMQE